MTTMRAASERPVGGILGGTFVAQASGAGAGGGAEGRGPMTRRRSRYFLDPPAGAATAPCARAGNLGPPPCPTRPASKVTAPRGRGSREAAGPSAGGADGIGAALGTTPPTVSLAALTRRPPRNRPVAAREPRREDVPGDPAASRPPVPRTGRPKLAGLLPRASRATFPQDPPKEIAPALRSFENQTDPTAVGCLPKLPGFSLRTRVCLPFGEILSRKCFSIFGCLLRRQLKFLICVAAPHHPVERVDCAVYLCILLAIIISWFENWQFGRTQPP